MKRLLAIVLTLIMSLNFIACSIDHKDSINNVKEKASEIAGNAGEKASEVAGDVASGAADVAGNVKDTAINTYNNVSDKISQWYQSINVDKFKDGWEIASNYAASTYGAAITSEYIASVANAINQLKQDINSSMGTARGIAQEAGFVAERWTADTFNINAALNGSEEQAYVVGSTDFGSVDVETTYGEKASLKYYKSGSGSAGAQAKSLLDAYKKYCNKTDNPESFEAFLEDRGIKNGERKDLYSAIYEGQTRIIPSGQMDKAVKFLKGKISEKEITDPQNASLRSSTYEETLFKLKDRLQAPDGTESIPLTYDEAQAITELAIDGKFKPEDFGVSITKIITPKYILKQAMISGVSSAAINTVLSAAPEIFAMTLDYIKTGEVDGVELKKLGVDSIFAAGEGFVEGSVSSTLVMACQSGALGATMENISPGAIASLTVLAINVARYSYSLSTDQITVGEYSNLLAENILASGASIAAGATLEYYTCSPFAYMVGSMVGGLFASLLYHGGEYVVMRIKDAGGFEAILPENVMAGIDLVKDTTLMTLESSKKKAGEIVTEVNEKGFIKVALVE